MSKTGFIEKSMPGKITENGKVEFSKEMLLPVPEEDLDEERIDLFEEEEDWERD